MAKKLIRREETPIEVVVRKMMSSMDENDIDLLLQELLHENGDAFWAVFTEYIRVNIPTMYLKHIKPNIE